MANSAADLDSQVNDFITFLNNDQEDTYIVSPMQIVYTAGGNFIQAVHYAITTPITVLQLNK